VAEASSRIRAAAADCSETVPGGRPHGVRPRRDGNDARVPESLLALLGVGLLAVGLLDALATTLQAGGGPGLLTGRLLRALWRPILAVHRRLAASRLLSLAGAALMVVTFAVWVLLLWAGWTLVFASADEAVVDAQTHTPAGFVSRIYYAGFTVFTLGVGDYVAGSDFWRVMTAVATLNGLVLVTLGITYLLNVIGAVVERRQTATRIAALGHTAPEIVAAGWSGSGLSSAFVQHLVGLADAISRLAEQHLAYPVLHYFHAREVVASAPVRLAILDDAMLVLSRGLEPSARPATSATEPVRQAIGRLLDVVPLLAAPPSPPPPPDLGDLRRRGLPVVGDAEFRVDVDAESERRARLRRLVEEDGWTWPDSGSWQRRLPRKGLQR
jgi:hypothetical protein